MAKTVVIKPTSIRFSPEDQKVIAELSKLTGITTTSELIKNSLRVNLREQKKLASNL